jgi:ABC-type multidrug transport system permease subunit
MKKAGWILIFISAAIIFYNVVIAKNYNQQQLKDHPFATLFSGGSNLKYEYTFVPPYSSFEVFVLAMAIGGIVLVLIACNRKSDS